MKRVCPRCAYSMGTPRPVNLESCVPVCPVPRRAHAHAHDHVPIGSWAHLTRWGVVCMTREPLPDPAVGISPPDVGRLL
jgi:hypothetical protein